MEAAEVEGAGAEGEGDDGGGGGDDLFASDKPQGQIIDGGNTASLDLGLNEIDDVDDDSEEEYIDLEKVSQDVGDGSLKADGTARGVFGNELKNPKGGPVSKGSSDLQMPNFANMIGNTRPQDSMNDPYDASWIRNWGKRNQMETKEQRLADLIAGMDGGIKDIVPKTLQPHLSFDTQKMLEKMDSKLGIKRLMTESNNYESLIEEQFDLDFEDDMEKDDD